MARTLIISKGVYYDRYIYERKIGIPTAVVDGLADGSVYAGQFPLQHYRQFFCGKDQ